MIVECLKCRRPYDVMRYAVGQKLRCVCGQVMIVTGEMPRPQTVRTLHCSSCGGNLEEGEMRCSYCGALVDFTSARLTAYCPLCCANSREGAAFCSGCGSPLTTPLDAPEVTEEACPRCHVLMRRRTIGAHKPLECPMCLGLFVAVDAFEELIRQQEHRIEEMASTGGPRQSVIQETQVTYIKCPVCGEMMNRENFGRLSGVIVDVCRNHGYWLDEGELERIAMWVATGGLKKKYQIEMEEAKAEAGRRRLEQAESRPFDALDAPFVGGPHSRNSGAFDFLEWVARMFG